MRCSSDVGKKCQTMLDMCRRYFYCWCCLCVRVQEVFPRHIQGLFSFCSDNVNFIHEIVTFKNIFDIIYTDALPIYYAVYKCFGSNNFPVMIFFLSTENKEHSLLLYASKWFWGRWLFCRKILIEKYQIVYFFEFKL